MYIISIAINNQTIEDKMTYNQIDHKDYIDSVKRKALIYDFELSSDIDSHQILRDIEILKNGERVYQGSLQGVEGFLKCCAYLNIRVN